MDYRSWIKPLYNLDALQGCGEEEIEAMKARFGALPQVVEDFYRTAAKTEAFHYVQDSWVLPEHYKRWTWLEKTDALILLLENQSVCFAGILREDLEKPDPPVYVSYERDEKDWSLWAKEPGDWDLCAPSTSSFLAAALAYEAAFTFDHEPGEFYWYTPEEKAALQSRLTKLPFSLKNWCSEMEITLYQNAPDNLLALMSFQGEGEPQALYGAVTQESYQKLLAVLEGMGEPV